MRRGSTPTHIFNISLDADQIAKVRVLYAQNGQLVLRKEGSDCIIEGQTVTVKLTQQDTLAFEKGKAEVQVRVITPSGEAVVSKVCTVDVEKLLENEVFA